MLQRMTTPSIFNGWEQITRKNIARDGFNIEETKDFMPQMGPMVGRAITVVIEPSNPAHPRGNPTVWADYRDYVASQPGPKVVVVQDLDKPLLLGGFWGEVNSGVHKSLGCVGTIIDGGIRDLDEMTQIGFKALARRLCVGHAYTTPVRWGVEVEVFGRTVQPGQLIHADKHGFLAIPPEDEASLFEATRFMDDNECQTTIAAARSSFGKPAEQLLAELDTAVQEFSRKTQDRFGRDGEWK